MWVRNWEGSSVLPFDRRHSKYNYRNISKIWSAGLRVCKTFHWVGQAQHRASSFVGIGARPARGGPPVSPALASPRTQVAAELPKPAGRSPTPVSPGRQNAGVRALRALVRQHRSRWEWNPQPPASGRGPLLRTVKGTVETKV